MTVTAAKGGGPKPIPSNPEKAGCTTYTRAGATIIGLFMPFEINGKQIEEIVIAPFEYEMTLEWRRGKYQSNAELLAAICHVDKEVLHRVKYPDMDRVMFAFMNSLPNAIREDILQGNFPPPPEAAFGVDPLPGAETEEFNPENYPKPTREPGPQEPTGTAGTGMDLDG